MTVWVSSQQLPACKRFIIQALFCLFQLSFPSLSSISTRCEVEGFSVVKEDGRLTYDTRSADKTYSDIDEQK